MKSIMYPTATVKDGFLSTFYLSIDTFPVQVRYFLFDTYLSCKGGKRGGGAVEIFADVDFLR